MVLRFLGQIVLFAASVTVCAGRLHGHHLSPVAVTQELNRCLSAVRIAASRRGHAPQRSAGIAASRHRYSAPTPR